MNSDAVDHNSESTFHAVNRMPVALLPQRPHILIGVTSSQTCVILPDRLRAFRDGGFHVSLLSAPGELLNRTGQDASVETFAISMQRGISPASDCIALFRIWRLIRRLKPDIVEFSTPKAGLLGGIAARLCGVPARIYLLRGLKLETAEGLKRIFLLGAEWMSARCAHQVICNSRSLLKRSMEYGIASQSKLMILGEGSSNGVDTQRFSPGSSGIAEQLGIEKGVPVIGFVGRLTHDKGLPDLLDAFRLLLHREPNAYLLLVGWFDAAEDALDRRLRERIESHPQVIHTGFVQDTSAYYRAMDVLVLPSWREGFPNAVLEAAASGVPVVATHCTGSCDAVVPGITGLLIPPGRPSAICEALLKILGDPQLGRAMATAARAWVIKNYESSRVLGDTVAFYSAQVQQKAAPARVSSRRIAQSTTGLSVSQ